MDVSDSGESAGLSRRARRVRSSLRSPPMFDYILIYFSVLLFLVVGYFYIYYQRPDVEELLDEVRNYFKSRKI
jgi:hypothetical protein